MRAKLATRFLLFAGLCAPLTSVDMLLREGHSAPNSRIVFTSTRHRNADIFVMDAGGGNQERLTINSARDANPSWSPDRTHIAFVSDRGGGGHEINVMDARGKGAIKLTDGPRRKGHLDWSPDGKRIAYMAITLKDEFFQIYVIGADGRNRVRLTHKPEHHMDPSWSPDGRLIAYVWSPDIFVNPPAKIHLMTAEGEYLKQLSGDHRGNEYYPDFSPVGLALSSTAVSPASNRITIWGGVKKLEQNRR